MVPTVTYLDKFGLRIKGETFHISPDCRDSVDTWMYLLDLEDDGRVKIAAPPEYEVSRMKELRKIHRGRVEERKAWRV